MQFDWELIDWEYKLQEANKALQYWPTLADDEDFMEAKRQAEEIVSNREYNEYLDQ